MHYKNGREAKEGDSVIFIDEYKKRVGVGQVWAIQPGSDSCNCQVANIIPGGVTNSCMTLGKMIHAEDGLKSFEELQARAESTKT